MDKDTNKPNEKSKQTKPEAKVNEKGERIIMGTTKQLTVIATPPIAIKNGHQRAKPSNSNTSSKHLAVSPTPSIAINGHQRVTPKSSNGSATSPLHTRAVANFMRQVSGKGPGMGSGSWGSRVNIVTESCSFIPSTIASTFSLEDTQSPVLRRKSSEARKLGDLGEAAQVSTSCQENLDQSDVLEDPNYTDTIQSTDSAASLLRRTFSLPHDYHYSKQKVKHAREIFVDFYPHDGSGTLYQSTERTHSGGEDVEREISGFRQTMEDLLEKPEYVDSLESTSSRKGLLATAALSYAKDAKSKLPTWKEEDELSLTDIQIKAEKKRYTKNLVILSLCYMLLFTAFLSMRNLQSSINNEIGLTSLCILYASLFVSSILSTTVVQRLRPRNTMLVCFAGFVIYVACNFYPHYYTLLPASAIAGFSIANSYTAQATYLANIAMSYACISGKNFPIVLTRFNGIYYMFFQLAQIIGGVISSVVLMVGDSPLTQPEVVFVTANTTYNIGNDSISDLNMNFSDSLSLYGNSSVNPAEGETVGGDVENYCGSEYCHLSVTNEQSKLQSVKLYTLVGIFTLCGVCATTLLFIFLDPLEGEMKKTHSSLSKQLTACFKFFLDIRVVCLLPLMFYSLLHVSFMFGEYSKAFVTCSSGVHMVGYVMLTISSFCATSSYVNSKLAKHVDRKILIPIGYGIHLCMYVVMFLWSPTPATVYGLFIIAGIWGIADGIFVTQVISLLGVLFIDNKEPAFAGLKMCQAFAVCIFFLVSPYLCTSVKIVAMATIAVLAVLGYGILELILCKRQRQAENPKEILKKIGPTRV